MKLTRSKKIILMIVLAAFIVLLFNSNTVFAAINTEYSGTDTVPDTALEEAFEDSTLINLLGKLIYAVGRFLEWILGIIFKLLAGYSDFPWADKIVFNAVPLLDINFMNPGEGSFVKNDAIQGVLADLYSTIMTFAVAFFGIIVLITSIRLVISTIASEKAKYKQAIVDWLVGFVMLFCIHYFISFVFYLNEQLVVVASKIVKNQLQQAEVGMIKVAEAETEAFVGDLVEDTKNYYYNGTSVSKILQDNPKIISTWINMNSADDSDGIHELLTKDTRWWLLGADTNISDKNQYKYLGMIISWAANDNVSVADLAAIKSRITYYKSGNSGSQAIAVSDLKTIFSDTEYELLKEATGWTHNVIRKCNPTSSGYVEDNDDGPEYYLSIGVKEFNDKLSDKFIVSYQWTKVLNDLMTLKGASLSSSSSTMEKGTRLISDLASYFRQNAYEKRFRTTNVTGLTSTGNVQLQNMIMYTVLVAQSLILFVAYIKRLFYVIILAMMGPVVVVFDFFQKFGK